MKSVLPQNIRSIALLVAFSGGFLDVFTYLRYGTLAAAQTGNIIFMVTDADNGQSKDLILRFLSLVCFLIGVMLGAILKSKRKRATWRVYTLLPLLITTILVGLFNDTSYYMQLSAVILLAVGAGMMTTTFAIIETFHFNMMFTTGNLKNAVFGWIDFMTSKNKDDLTKARDYTLIFLSFLTGAILSKYLYMILNKSSILIVTVLLVSIWIIYLTLVNFEHLEETDLIDK